MDFLVVLLLLVIVAFLINLKNSVSHKLAELQHRLNLLANELKRHTTEAKASVNKDDLLTREEKIAKPQPPVTLEVPLPKGHETQSPLPMKEEETKVPEIIRIGNLVEERKKDAASHHVAQPKPGFFERNPDLEKFIGENLANKIGIAILVIGIGFFVKFAIDQNWINEYGRTLIGLLCGGVLLVLGHRMRKNFSAFSSVLVGGGIAILYLTVTIAFQIYGIIGQIPAFIVMVGITGFTIFLSILYNRLELAILAILGGFGAPFMVSNGGGNYVILFTYIAILDVGMLVLAYYRRWNSINVIAYIFTVILFGSWLGKDFNAENSGMITGGMIFATLFYFIFFAMNLVNNLKTGVKFRALEISLLLSNTFFYYAAGMIMLNMPDADDFKGLFTAWVAVINFVIVFSLYKRSTVDRNLVFLLIGLVLTFVSLAAPVQLEGNYITMFWAAEAVLLLWLSQQSGIRLMKLASVVVMALMTISLLMDWEILYFLESTEPMRIILNKAYITGLFSVASVLITLQLLKREGSNYREHVQRYKLILAIVVVILVYFSQLFELHYHVVRLVESVATQNIIIGIYNLAFLTCLSLILDRLNIPNLLKAPFAGSGVLGILVYLFFYHKQVIIARGEFLADSGGSGFWLHYILIVVLIALAITSLHQFQKLDEFNRRTNNAYSWFFVFFFVFIASAELDHSVLLAINPEVGHVEAILRQNHKVGYPILWGLSAFVLIVVGLRTKRKNLRIISLTLLLITLLKLFLLDIRGISEGGKIAAFISLGILLLIVSFMYQRLKKIFLSDEHEGNDSKTSSL